MATSKIIFTLNDGQWFDATYEFDLLDTATPSEIAEKVVGLQVREIVRHREAQGVTTPIAKVGFGMNEPVAEAWLAQNNISTMPYKNIPTFVLNSNAFRKSIVQPIGARHA